MRPLLLAPALLVLLCFAPAASACAPVPNPPPQGVACSLLPIPAGGATDIAIHAIEWASCVAIVALQNTRQVALTYGTWALSCV